MDRDAANASRYVPGRPSYESWFARANHPSDPRAFWIRYTIFAPASGPALGELWAIVSDRDRIVAVREEHPIDRCRFDRRRLDLAIASAAHDDRSLEGRAALGAHAIAWSLRFTSPDRPLLLLPPALYRAPIPRAKQLAGSPLARFDGTIEVDGAPLAIDGWIGSQCHNWGSRHTDAYAWGQVAGFDGDPDAFLELTTARIAPRAPRTTIGVLRLGGDELRFDGALRAVRAPASYAPFRWSFELTRRDARLRGTIDADPRAFVALPYRNPPGGTKWCLNTKLARARVEIERHGAVRVLETTHRAAFEILGDDPPPPGVARLGDQALGM